MDALVAPGRHVVQAVHGLPRRLHARRREHLQGAAANREERRHDLHARRERRRDRRARAAGARRRARPRRSTTRSRGRRAPRPRRRTARSRSPRSPTCRSTSSTCRRPRRSRWSPRRATAACRLCRDVPAVPVPLVRQLRGAGLRRREVRDEPAAARPRQRRIGCGAGSPSTICRRSRPTTARSA